MFVCFILNNVRYLGSSFDGHDSRKHFFVTDCYAVDRYIQDVVAKQDQIFQSIFKEYCNENI